MSIVIFSCKESTILIALIFRCNISPQIIALRASSAEWICKWDELPGSAVILSVWVDWREVFGSGLMLLWGFFRWRLRSGCGVFRQVLSVFRRNTQVASGFPEKDFLVPA